jgi:hypothetical protein
MNNSLQKIKEIVKIAPVKSNIQSKSFYESELDLASILIKKQYKLLLRKKITQINREFRGLYGKNLDIKENEVSDIHFNISQIISTTGKNFKFLKKKIEFYIGEEVSFIKKDGSLVDYKLLTEINEKVESKASKEEIKKYFL